jgi:hypothetical protein
LNPLPLEISHMTFMGYPWHRHIHKNRCAIINCLPFYLMYLTWTFVLTMYSFVILSCTYCICAYSEIYKLKTKPSPKDDLCQVWLKLAQWFWRRSRKCKNLQTNGRTDDGQPAIRIAHLSFQLRWAKNLNVFIWASPYLWRWRFWQTSFWARPEICHVFWLNFVVLIDFPI